MKNEFEHKGFYFNEGTPIRLADKLIELHKSRERIVFDYGDIKTNKSWGEVYDISGRVGKSTGTKPILILVHNTRCLGGGAISTDCILSIKLSKGKKLIYSHNG